MTNEGRLYLLHAPAPSPSLVPRRRYEEWKLSLDLKDVGEAECLTTPAIGGARALQEPPRGADRLDHFLPSPTRRSSGGVTIVLISIAYTVVMASLFFALS
ncbi:hypothetical protein EV421DRAFT_2032750 [Armillaria borealis]|uniref:Uncharacterized protein n=1 Tax=Armillaria borealis TaxID=47425 RepID=A0AA39JW55_9AGAR|nr:hypothetical protein EV421DRAFT_2032750 [Armillaria borealis]